MKVCSLLSGGKDSVYAIYWAMNQAWDVPCAISIKPRNPDSWMFHYPNAWITDLQSKAIGLESIVYETDGQEDKELEDLEKAIKLAISKYNIEGVISGALASEYQRIRIERVCHKLGIKSFAPLWHKNQSMLLRDMLRAGFEIMIVGVSADGLGVDWLGRIMDLSMVEELERLQRTKGIWPGGEGGEYETLVLDGPIFRSRIVIDKQRIDWNNALSTGTLVVEKAHLESKG